MHADFLSMAVALACVTLASSSLPSKDRSGIAVTHVSTRFRFTVNAPIEQASPLFGAHEERKWAPGWDPQFLYPVPANDQLGSVFVVRHGDNASVWTTTAFDLAAGHVQYVCVIAAVMVTRIDIRMTRKAGPSTGVSVLYERTALNADANEHVKHAAKQDEGFGKEWEEQINGYLRHDRTR